MILIKLLLIISLSTDLLKRNGNGNAPNTVDAVKHVTFSKHSCCFIENGKSECYKRRSKIGAIYCSYLDTFSNRKEFVEEEF